MILIVDDDRTNCRIAQHILEQKFQIDICYSGEDALSFLDTSEELPDMILLDLHMPKMDGFEVIENLHKRDKCKDIPVILLTSDNDRDTEVKGFKLGASDFISKPYVTEIMLQRIERILQFNLLQKHLQKEVDKQTRTAELHSEKLERLSIQLVQTLVGTIDAKDKYTNGHSVRVAEYAKEILKRNGGSERDNREIYYMGLLHDIGKIGISDEIINKTGKLTDNEYNEIKRHPSIGYEILKNISEIPEIAVGAKWHHERYDGKGYPDGLRGEEIPNVARIIGVADAYDAMTSNRSYRRALPQEIVKQEFIKGIGTQFDPVYAKIMISIMEEDLEYLLREIV